MFLACLVVALIMGPIAVATGAAAWAHYSPRFYQRRADALRAEAERLLAESNTPGLPVTEAQREVLREIMATITTSFELPTLRQWVSQTATALQRIRLAWPSLYPFDMYQQNHFET